MQLEICQQALHALGRRVDLLQKGRPDKRHVTDLLDLLGDVRDFTPFLLHLLQPVSERHSQYLIQDAWVSMIVETLDHDVAVHCICQRGLASRQPPTSHVVAAHSELGVHTGFSSMQVTSTPRSTMIFDTRVLAERMPKCYRSSWCAGLTCLCNLEKQRCGSRAKSACMQPPALNKPFVPHTECCEAFGEMSHA